MGGFTERCLRHQVWGEPLGTAAENALEAYHKNNGSVSQSIEKNFIIKLLYWIGDTLALSYLKNWNPGQSMKFIARVASGRSRSICSVII